MSDSGTDKDFGVKENKLLPQTSQQPPKNNQNLTVSEKQERLQKNYQKLRQVRGAFSSKDTHQPTNNNFTTSLVIGGALLIIIGLVSILVIKKARKIKK